MQVCPRKQASSWLADLEKSTWKTGVDDLNDSPSRKCQKNWSELAAFQKSQLDVGTRRVNVVWPVGQPCVHEKKTE